MQPSSGMSAADRVVVAISVVLGVAVIAATAVVMLSRPAPVEITILPPPATATPAPSATLAPITVYVTGAVNQPNRTHTLPHASRVEAAIAAAGGLRSDALLDSVNMAGILRDGDQVHVRSAADSALPPTPLDHDVVYVNTATLEQLMTLPEIGQRTAAAIIAHREANGRFNTLADLDAVEGIGERTLELLRPLVRFD